MTVRTGVAVQLERVTTMAAAVPAPVAATLPAAVLADPVEALRRRLAGSTAREHVVLDFLSDDLREARESLAVLQAYLGGIETALAGPDVTQQKLLALSLGGGPIDQIDYLAEVLSGVRRRMAQVAARM